MATIELIYFPGCPHVAAAREQVKQACAIAGADAAWNEIDATADDAPAHARACGSPTVLVDGRDVTGEAPGGGTSCRVYVGSEVRGAPPVAAIVAALRGSR